MRPPRERVLGLLDADDAPAVMVRPPRDPAALELSVILPARDEAQTLHGCLETLLQQSEPGFALGKQWEIIVVDDASSDATRAVAIAAGDPAAAGFSVLDAPLFDARVGLTGKSSACWAGAQRAEGGRLLFTDADTRFEPGSLSRSLREAERHEAALLSYSPRDFPTGAVDGLILPLVLSEVASVYPPAQVNDLSRPLAAASGQFLLVERDAYFDAGGHRALGQTMVDGLALARNIKRAGARLRVRHAPEALAVRRQQTSREMVEGWTRTLAGLLPSPVALAAWRLLDFVLLFGLPVLAAGIPHLVLWQRAALLLLWLRTGLRYYTRVAKAHMGGILTAVSPLGLPLFAFLLLRSTWAYRVRRRVTWKGRSYDPGRG